MVLLSSMTSTLMLATASLLTGYLLNDCRSAKFVMSNRDQICTISKSSFRAPHSGQTQFIGTSSQRVPGLMPCSGSPVASSYVQPQIRHIHVRNLLASLLTFGL